MCSPRLLNPDPAAKKSNISNYFSQKLQIQIQVPIFSTGTGFSPFSSLSSNLFYGGGADDDDDNNRVGGGVHASDVVDDHDNGKKQRGYGYGCGIGCTRSFTKARQAILNPFTKAKKQFLRRKNKRTSSSSSGSTGARISGC
nr:hypothetical protein CFP56_76724 [Quercus suber]